MVKKGTSDILILMERIEVGTMVRNTHADEEGVVALDIMGCCSDNEEPVVYEGRDAFIGTDRSHLEVTGTYDPTVANPELCGAGQGEKTCRYLTFGDGNFLCGRFSEFRNAILSSNTTAKGVPKGLYPQCQEDIQAAIREAD